MSELISCMSYRVDLSIMGNVTYSKDFKTKYDAENKTPLTQHEGSIHKLLLRQLIIRIFIYCKSTELG